jgi:hypothetical protein
VQLKSGRASAARQLTDTAKDLLGEAKLLTDRAKAAPPGTPEKTRLEARARESLAKAKTIAQSVIKLAE